MNERLLSDVVIQRGPLLVLALMLARAALNPVFGNDAEDPTMEALVQRGATSPARFEFAAAAPAAAWRRQLRHLNYILVTAPTAGTGGPDRHTLWLLPGASSPVAPRPLAIDAIHHADAQVRADAVADLAPHEDALALGALSMALGDPDQRVREAAIVALALDGRESDASLLAPALADRSARIREAAVDALADIGGPLARSLLRQAAADPVSFVREAATAALGGQRIRR